MRKKLLMILLLGSMILTLAACGKENPTTGKKETKSSVSIEIEPSVPNFDVASFDLSAYEMKYVEDIRVYINGTIKAGVTYEMFDDFVEGSYEVGTPYGAYINIDGKERYAYEHNTSELLEFVVTTDTPGKVTVVKCYDLDKRMIDKFHITDSQERYDRLEKYVQEQYEKTGMKGITLIEKTYEADGFVKGIVVADVAGKVSDLVVLTAGYEGNALYRDYFVNANSFGEQFYLSSWSAGLYNADYDVFKNVIESKAISTMHMTSTTCGEFDVKNITYIGTLSNGMDVYGYDSSKDIVGDEIFSAESVEDFKNLGYKAYSGKGILDGYTLMTKMEDDYDLARFVFIKADDTKCGECAILTSIDCSEKDGVLYYTYCYFDANGDGISGYVHIDDADGTAYAITYDDLFNSETVSEPEVVSDSVKEPEESIEPEQGEITGYALVYDGSGLSDDLCADGICEFLECDLDEAELIVSRQSVVALYATEEDAKDAVDTLSESSLVAEYVPVRGNVNTDNIFRIDAVFSLIDRGTVVTGYDYKGILKSGQEVYLIKTDGTTYKVTIGGIEEFRKIVEETSPGKGCGIELKNIERSLVGEGDILVPVE